MKVNFSYSINIKVQHTKTALRVLFPPEMGVSLCRLGCPRTNKDPPSYAWGGVTPSAGIKCVATTPDLKYCILLMPSKDDKVEKG